jgi:hypothetical protein
MLLPIRRPVRPEPRPLNERTATDLVDRLALIWLSVRYKRSRKNFALLRVGASGTSNPITPALRGLPSSPRK